MGCDKFRKVQQESAKWTGTVILYGALHAFLPHGPPTKARTTQSLRARGPCPLRSGWCWTCDLAHSEKFPLRQRYLTKTKCWTLDLWMLVGPVAGVTPLARLQNLPRPQSCCRSGILLRKSRCPKQIQISGLGTGTRLS